MTENDIEHIGSRVITIRNTQVIVDRDVADIYGVTTKEINQAIRNNPQKFPEGYVITLNNSEKTELVKNFDRLKTMKFSTVAPHAFTEKGLYMLATILKSEVATEATIAIIETFTKLRELARTIEATNESGVVDEKNQNKMQKLMTEVFTNNLPVTMKKTTFSINTGIIKFSVETTRQKKD